MTSFNVFAHSDKLEQITRNVFKILKPEGQFVIEVQYLLDTLKDVTFDNIYHEHYNYWSVLSLSNFFKRLGLHITDVEHKKTHGGSIRVFIGSQSQDVKQSVSEFLQKEKEFGLDKLETYKEFSKKIEKCKEDSVSKINNIKDKDPATLVYDNHGMQLSAYAEGFEVSDPERISIFVDRQDPSYISCHIWDRDTHKKHLTMFNSLLTYWKLMKNYDSAI